MAVEEQIERAERVLDASDEFLRACGALSPEEAAEALAIALGRVCSGEGVPIEKAIAIARLADDPDPDREVMAA